MPHKTQQKKTSASSKSLPVVLLTNFDANPGFDFNASSRTVQAIGDTVIEGHHIVTVELPTVFKTCLPALRKLIAKHKPTVVICVGEARKRSAISIERIAINVIDASRPDNAGKQPIDIPVISKAPAAYFSTLPIKAMQKTIQKAGIPAEISQTAGTFVCNCLFFGLMHDLATRKELRGIRGGFIHIPFLTEQSKDPQITTMPLEQTVAALRLAIKETIKTVRS